jgi:hypothetical protein
VTRRQRLAAALLAAAFAAFYAGTTRGVFVFGDDFLAFQVCEAIVERGEVAVTAPPGRRGVGRAIRGVDGRGYSKYGLGLPLATIPFYVAGRHVERAGLVLPEERDARGNLRTGTRVFAAGLVNAAAGGLAVLALVVLAVEAGFAFGVALVLGGLLGGATFFSHYGATLLSEPLAAAALTFAAAAALRARATGSRWAAAASGAAAGLALLTKVAHLVAVAPLGVWLAWALWRDAQACGAQRTRRRAVAVRLVLLWLGFAGLFAAGVAVYNVARFGSPFETGYGGEATRFTTPPWVGLAGLLFSPGKGLFWYAPPLLLALAGWRALARRRRDVGAVALAVILGPLWVAATFYQWHGGGSWGPRLLLPVLPILLLGAGVPVERALAGSRFAAAAVAGAAAAGALVVALATLVPFDRYFAEVAGRDGRLGTDRFRRMIWSVSDSPLPVHLRQSPDAGRTTARLLLGLEPLPGPLDKGRRDLPDFAFVRYGSHALLEWTRGALLVAVLAGAAAVAAARRSQKASLSRPPQ